MVPLFSPLCEYINVNGGTPLNEILTSVFSSLLTNTIISTNKRHQ